MEGDLNDKRLMSPHQLWNSALVLCLLRVSCFSEDTLSPQQVDSNLTNRTGPDIPDPNRGLQPIIPVLSVTWKEREWLLWEDCLHPESKCHSSFHMQPWEEELAWISSPFYKHYRTKQNVRINCFHTLGYISIPSPGCLSTGMNSGSDGLTPRSADCGPELALGEQSGAAEPMRRYQSSGLQRGSRTENTPEICAGIPKTILGGRQSYARFTRIHALGREEKRVLEIKESSEMLGFWYAQRKRPWHHGPPANKPGSWFLSNKEHPPPCRVWSTLDLSWPNKNPACPRSAEKSTFDNWVLLC